MANTANTVRRNEMEERSRIDSERKATGSAKYTADLTATDVAYVAVARSTRPHAKILGIDTSPALAISGVIGVFTSADVAQAPYGRAVQDSPILAIDRVRFVGERIAAVVAEDRDTAELAAGLIEVDYEDLPAVFNPEEALTANAPHIHDQAWAYPGSGVAEGDAPNLQFAREIGDKTAVEEALASAAHIVDHTYTTQGVHQGYLEPQACMAKVTDGHVDIWITNKAPFGLRNIIGRCLGINPGTIQVHPSYLGGDFGGKGSPGDAPLCVELSRLTNRTVKLVLRYSEDLVATNPRHPATFRVRLGCDEDGVLVAAALDIVFNGGAYAGFTPGPSGPHGAYDIEWYRLPAFFAKVQRVYTNTVPRGNMRAPGGPQSTFAFESAMDELALVAGVSPEDIRRRNLLKDDDPNLLGHKWVEQRGIATLDAALAAFVPVDPPPGWLHGWGMAAYSRPTTNQANTSLRLIPIGNEKICVETGIVETGTGSHTVLRELIAEKLGFSPDNVDVVQVSTDELPREAGAGASRVTAGLAIAVDAAAKSWLNRLEDGPVVVDVNETAGPAVGSYCVQIAQVGVDPQTGSVKVLELLNVVDVAEIINQKAHRMQIEGGAAMGLGYALLEDLSESDGQIWAANLGEYKLPSMQDMPTMRTVLLPGGIGIGTANIKSIGEVGNVPVAAAVANAVASATSVRLRTLPIKSEDVFNGLEGRLR